MTPPSLTFALPTGTRRVTARLAVTCGVILLALLVAACGSGGGETSGDGSDNGTSAIAAGDVLPGSDMDGVPSQLGHVHGIGRNPADGAIYIATHYGLWRMAEGSEPERVGNNAHDYMGFSVVGKDHFVASGHPNGAPGLPPHLGLIETRDAGKTWRSVSLLGEADFHVLRAASGRTYGVNAGKLMATSDQREWDTVAEDVPAIDIAVDPDGVDYLVAATAVSDTRLELRSSSDGGSSFTAIEGAPQLVRLAWTESDELWGVDTTGTVWRSRDRGKTWKESSVVGGIPEAFADTGDELLAAVNGKIMRSDAEAAEWESVYSYG